MSQITILTFLTLCIIQSTISYSCTTEVVNSDGANGPIITFVDCNAIFEICCDNGCCPRFSHAHVWIFAAGLSFILFICIFGCWLYCCKGHFHRGTTGEERLESPLTSVSPETRTDTTRTNVNENANLATPPPSYEEATAMR